MVKVPLPKLEGYVIYNPEKELFSSGGTNPKWQKKPKIWGNLGHLKNHLHMAIGPHPAYYEDKVRKVCTVYKGCVVINIVTQETLDFDIYEYVLEKWKNSYFFKQGYVLKYVK